MLNFIKNFRNDEDGAVTVDFVVLTAAIVLLGLAVGGAITRGATSVAESIEGDLDYTEIQTSVNAPGTP
jgi:Flp pilus assembly pilin Flp